MAKPESLGMQGVAEACRIHVAPPRAESMLRADLLPPGNNYNQARFNLWPRCPVRPLTPSPLELEREIEHT